MGLPARARPVPASLEFAVAAEPGDVAGCFLARGDVAQAEGELTGHGRDPGYALERTAGGFNLTSDPGTWRPGMRAICEVEVAPREGGSRVVVRFRVHPLTRASIAYILALGLGMAIFQLVVAGPAIAATMLPFGILLALLAADRRNYVREQRSLRTLVESTLTPIALPHELRAPAPFRRG